MTSLGWKTRLTTYASYSAVLAAINKTIGGHESAEGFGFVLAYVFAWYFLPVASIENLKAHVGLRSRLAAEEEASGFFSSWMIVTFGPMAVLCLIPDNKEHRSWKKYASEIFYESPAFSIAYMWFVTAPLLCMEQVVSKVQRKIEQNLKQLLRRLTAVEARRADPASELQEQWDLLASRLSAAEAAASDSVSKLQAVQVEFRKYKEQCEQLTSRSQAMYEESRKRLTEQLAKVETKTLATMDVIQALRIGNATWEGQRLHQAQQQRTREDVSPAASSSQTSRGEGSNFVQRMGYEVVEVDAGHGDDDDDDANSSALSHSSWFSVQPHCFMVQALFKTRSYGVDFFLMGKDLKKGSQVVGADDKTILEVSEAPQLCRATEVVDLQAGDAALQVTPDHLVLVPGDGRGAENYVAAGGLKMGDLIMLDSGEPAPLTSVTIQPKVCDVLKIVFEPDLPVAVFSCPPSILSKGQRIKPKVRRARMCYRGQASADQTADGGVSVPMTAGDYMD